MKFRSKTEQVGLEKLSKDSMIKVSIQFDKKKVDTKLILTAKKYFGDKSLSSVIVASSTYISALKNTKGNDLLEQTNLDKLSLLKKITDSKKLDNNKKLILAKIPKWQLILILSTSPKEISSQEQLIIYILTILIDELAILFGEDKE